MSKEFLVNYQYTIVGKKGESINADTPEQALEVITNNLIEDNPDCSVRVFNYEVTDVTKERIKLIAKLYQRYNTYLTNELEPLIGDGGMHSSLDNYLQYLTDASYPALLEINNGANFLDESVSDDR